MKRIVAALLLFHMMGLKAQSFQKGQKDINLGLGFGVPFASGHYRLSPPISGAFDFGITDQISIGGYLGFTTVTWRFTGSDWCKTGPNWVYYNYDDRYRWSYYIFGMRGAFHFAEFIKEDKVDLYAGLMLGWNYATYKFTTNEPCRKGGAYSSSSYGGGVAWAAYVGCRYRFTEKLGVFGEFGYGMTYLTIGINFKL